MTIVVVGFDSQVEDCIQGDDGLLAGAAPDLVIAGNMLTMVGGDEEIFGACRPVMESYANAIFHLGPVGAG